MDISTNLPHPESESVEAGERSLDHSNAALDASSFGSMNAPQCGVTSNDLQRIEIGIRRIASVTDPAREEFIGLYQAAFAGAPYYEVFPRPQIEASVWNKHIEGGHALLIAESNNSEELAILRPRVIGLACAHAAISNVEPEIRDFLIELRAHGKLPFDLENTLFISELCTDATLRRQGIGTRLTIELLRWGADHGFTHWATRTAAEGSNSIRIFKTLGGIEFGPLHYVGENVSTNSLQRVYLHADLDSSAGSIVAEAGHKTR